MLDEDKIRTTLVIFKFDSQNKEISETITGVGNTVKGARRNANSKTSFELTPGQIRMEIYGKETAKKGLMDYLDTLIRDAKVSDTMFLTVSNTTAKEVIQASNEKGSVHTGKYLYELILQSVEDYVIPRVTIQDFIHYYYDVGQDPFLPVLSVKNGPPALSSLAIFKDDKYVGQIPVEQAYIINIFKKSIEQANLEISLPIKPFKDNIKKAEQIENDNDNDNFHVILTVLNGKSSTKMTDPNGLKYRTNINLNVNMSEISKEINIDNPKVIAKMEKELEKDIKQQFEKLLKKMQGLNADPFGYGTVYRANKTDEKLKKQEWRNKFPDISVDFNVNVKILRHGTTP
ncbi:Ger(x)C family spore germination protein [Virgibacillus doumboii]|uniref:Ger(x)C family spore germination protein n=1 Tax=Virgibacillus doumboii TaxID=2697503 RepID=UPI0013E09399|nr:Ger(x)C family spore germination protein [Virgibacillus doumboii]